MAQQKPKETNFVICITSVLRNKELPGTKSYQKELLQRADQVLASEFSDIKKSTGLGINETECYSVIHCFYYSGLFHI